MKVNKILPHFPKFPLPLTKTSSGPSGSLYCLGADRRNSGYRRWFWFFRVLRSHCSLLSGFSFRLGYYSAVSCVQQPHKDCAVSSRLRQKTHSLHGHSCNDCRAHWRLLQQVCCFRRIGNCTGRFPHRAQSCLLDLQKFQHRTEC